MKRKMGSISLLVGGIQYLLRDGDTQTKNVVDMLESAISCDMANIASKKDKVSVCFYDADNAVQEVLEITEGNSSLENEGDCIFLTSYRSSELRSVCYYGKESSMVNFKYKGTAFDMTDVESTVRTLRNIHDSWTVDYTNKIRVLITDDVDLYNILMGNEDYFNLYYVILEK